MPNDDQEWVEFILGQSMVGDRARVKPDAYDGSYASHNGLEGKVVGVRNRMVLVRYDGVEDDTLGSSHAMEFVEVHKP